MKCFKCGATTDRAILFDVISKNGVVKICNSCYKQENLPLVKQASESKPVKTSQNYGKFSGIPDRKGIGRRVLEQDKTLRDVVDSNFKRNLGNIRPRDDLIDNFHWVMMRVRRANHLTQTQLADAIGEPELAVKMAEEGVLGENSDVLIKKIENYFGIRLKKDLSQYKQERKIEELKFNSGITDELTISDLKELQEEKEKVDKIPFWKSWMKKGDKGDSEEVDSVEEADFEPYEESEERQLSDEEVDDVLFGKKKS